MAMARIKYSMQVEGEGIARAKASELPISPKHAIEIADFIRHMDTTAAIEYLNNVVALKKPIPFKHFNRNVAHKRGLKKWASGRYPEKAARAFIRLLTSVGKNAEYNGLDTTKLRIVHISANRGRGHDAFFPRAMGRATPKRRETVNLEVIVREVE
jgi:large subunit ribosomal protein L22